MKKAIQIVCVTATVAALGSAAYAGLGSCPLGIVPVGNPGNVADYTGYGAVDYEYNIGKYEVTAGQYCEFLNAVAETDIYGLYNSNMNDEPSGCQITRIGSSGSYVYNFSGRPSGIEDDWSNRPVNYVSWGDAARFANWLHNGQPGGGEQDNSTTEDGVYDLSATQSHYGSNGETPAYHTEDWYALNAALLAASRDPDWKWAIASEDEWYKAAYHKKNDGVAGNYFAFPTGSNSVPSNDLTTPDDGNNATYYIREDDHTIGSPYYRTEGGAHENSESPYDTFDQGGNLWEWNEAVLLEGTHRGYRGSAFNNYDFRLQASVRSGSDPTYETYSVGFRVSEVPEPATMAVLALGGLAVLRRRNRLETTKPQGEDA